MRCGIFFGLFHTIASAQHTRQDIISFDVQAASLLFSYLGRNCEGQTEDTYWLLSVVKYNFAIPYKVGCGLFVLSCDRFLEIEETVRSVSPFLPVVCK